MSSVHGTIGERVSTIALFAAAVFGTAAATARLPLWGKGIVSLAVSLVFWQLAAPILLKIFRLARAPLRPGWATIERALDRADQIPERIATRLDGPMTALGLIFLALVVAEYVVGAGRYGDAFRIASWVIWGAFVLEFVVRLWAAPSPRGYLKRNWWQLVFLALPFLRFLRAIRVLRIARSGRVVSSAIRSVRSATSTLTGRLGWVLAVHTIVVLAASQLLFEYGTFASYGDALAATALSAVAGEPTGAGTGVARVLDVAFAIYAAVMFAALAGALAAFFLERRQEKVTIDQERRLTA